MEEEVAPRRIEGSVGRVERDIRGDDSSSEKSAAAERVRAEGVRYAMAVFEESQRLLGSLGQAEDGATVEGLPTTLENILVDDGRSIREVELSISARKRAFDIYCQELTPAERARVEARITAPLDTATSAEEKAECVVCQDRGVERAVVPCGHHCLCDECARILTTGGAGLCPLCRGNVQSTLKIFSFCR